MDIPCKNCPKQGCGSYHDICPEYQEFRQHQLASYEERIIIGDTVGTLNWRERNRKRRFKNTYSPRKQG